MSYIRKEKSSFVIYYDFERQTENLSDEQLGRLLRIMFDYEIREIEPDKSDELFMAFQFVKTYLDINKEKYAEICEQNAKNGKKGGNGRGHKKDDDSSDGNNLPGGIPFPDSWR